MQHIHSVNKLMLFLAIIGIIIMLTTGCQKETITSPTLSEEEYSEEVAVSIAALCSENTGGIIDQSGELLLLADSNNEHAFSKNMGTESPDTKTATYDSISKIWTVVVIKNRNNNDGSQTAHFTRTYTHQFLNKDGEPQKRWITEGDTAHSIIFNILNGSGEVHKPKMSHYLNSISGSWTATNTHTDEVTLDGSYQRAALDSIFHNNGTRVSDHQVQMTLIDVIGPRGSRRDLSQKVSGTLKGTYTATITVTKSKGVMIREVEHDITVVIEDGQLDIQIDKEAYSASADEGDLTS